MKKLFFLKILFICFLVGAVIYRYWNNTKLVSLRIPSSSGTDIVLMLPNKDKKYLNFFFHQLMVREGGIYTLVGNKPMSLSGYWKPFTSFRLLDLYQSCLPENLKMYWGWQTYLKYKYLFENSKFLLWSEQCPWGESSDLIIFMNKVEVDSIIKRWSQDFCDVLKKETICIEELLQQARDKPLFLEVLRKNEGLIGTLLGYGRDNAWLFLKRCLGEDITLALPWDEHAQIEILNKLYGWPSFFRKEPQDISEELLCPNFVADVHSEETKQLKENYLSIKERIIDIYKGKDFLEITLSLMLGKHDVEEIL